MSVDYAPKRGRETDRFRLKSNSVIQESIRESDTSFRESELNELSSCSNSNYCMGRIRDTLSSNITEKIHENTQKSTSVVKAYSVIDK